MSREPWAGGRKYCYQFFLILTFFLLLLLYEECSLNIPPPVPLTCSSSKVILLVNPSNGLDARGFTTKRNELNSFSRRRRSTTASLFRARQCVLYQLTCFLKLLCPNISTLPAKATCTNPSKPITQMTCRQNVGMRRDTVGRAQGS